MRYPHLFLLVLLLLIGSVLGGNAKAQNVKTYIPPKAIPLIPVIKEELQDNFSHIPQPWYLPALIEHESCLSLRHSKCWSTTSQLNTKWKTTGNRREHGAGLGQITRAWTEAGKLRFDTLANLKRMYPIELSGLTWDNMSSSPDLQIRAMILLLRSDYTSLRAIPDPVERLKFTDSAYNGGVSDVNKARKICGMTKGCDHNVWFNNVEKHSVKSTKVLYGDRSPKEINTHHVRDVFLTRMPKYKPLIPSL